MPAPDLDRTASSLTEGAGIGTAKGASFPVAPNPGPLAVPLLLFDAPRKART